ncbi:fasciclin domain-containing protein [Carboxylicivirga sediminis]|uniref:Fasciclin domain-containing protein n=1 Tax=Carboxylicivirga sediminis TaxID=2006564 RepID=A0A941IY74_9BACT|nr:fasciclin domain-containing protein [Carboxylicivirga sediminis]MBR8536263.1 fasciclin domain-containing protein [Carboxylicivirga sediminis]
MDKSMIKSNRLVSQFFLVGFLAVAVIFAGCEKDASVAPENDTEEQLYDIETTLEMITENPEFLQEDGNSDLKRWRKFPTFRNLTYALFKTRLFGTVVRNQFTVFAPTDEAFEKLFDQIGVKSIREVPSEQLKTILLYHVVAGKVKSTQLSNGFVPTLNGAAFEVNLDNGVMINNAEVQYADIRALNGIIHIIDEVLLPPTQNLVEIAQANEAFSILVQAVIKADLAETLAAGGPFTVFAPTDDAFVALLDELGPDVNSLDDIPVDLLTQVLLYHVVDGRVYSSDLPAGPADVPTLQGETFAIDVTIPSITDANSREAGLVGTLLNIQGTNGVIHVIDRVILPTLP